jgi:replicative DNA helicase
MSDFLPTMESESASIQSQPYNQQAEEAVLGAVLINPDAYVELAQILQPEHFYIIRNGWIWQAYSNLNTRQVPIDLLTVAEELEKHDQLIEAGGQPYLVSLVNQTPTSVNAEAYARIVEDNFIRRRLLSAANEMAKMAFNQEKPVDGILDSAEKSIFGLSERRTRKEVVPIQVVISDYYDRVSESSKQKDEILGLPTGLIDIDNLLGCMQNSDLIIVAGRPGSGKTGFLLSVANNVALKTKKHVAFFSMEMSNEQLLQRLLAQVTGINTQRLRSGKIEEDEWELFTEGIEILNNAVIFLDETPSLTPMQLRTKCRQLHLEHKLDLVLIDYIQLMVGDARTENRVQEVSYISRNLKALAKELKIPVMAAAQLSRASEMRDQQQKRKDEPKEYRLSDLRESGSLEQDADVVMFIDRDLKKEGISRVIVAKHRNGPTNESGIEVVFRSDLTKFDNALTRIEQSTLQQERSPKAGKPK